MPQLIGVSHHIDWKAPPGYEAGSDPKILFFPMVFGVFPDFPNWVFRSIYHCGKDLLIAFACSASKNLQNTFTTPGVPLKDDGRGGPKTQNAWVDSEPNAALCQIEGPRFRQRPCAVPFFGKRDVPFHRRRRADWRDAVKVGRTFGTTGPLLLLSVNDFGGTGLAETDHLSIFIHTAVVIGSLKEGRQTASEIHRLPCG